MITSANVQIAGYTVNCEQPVVLGWAGNQPTAGTPADLRLSRLVPGAQYQVAFGSVVADATAIRIQPAADSAVRTDR